MQSRKEILVRNTKFSFIKTIIQYVLQFVLRTVMIYTLGKEYLGISGLFSNIIGCLSLVELGMGTAIVYSMYKPIADNDIEKVKSLNNLYKRIYLIIALIITVVGVSITPIITFFIDSGIPENLNIYIIYLIFLFNTIISYFSAHKRSLLFAYQRNDVESRVRIFSLIALYCTEIVALVVFKNYYAYVICLPTFTIIESIIIYISAQKLFPKITGKSQKLDVQTKKEITKNISALGMHQLGGVLVLSTDNILMSSILGLAILGIYSNYAALIACITAFVTLVTTTAQSTLGNLVATEDKEYVEKKYNEFNFIMMWIVGFCSICLVTLLNDFILIWTGSEEYLMPIGIVIVLVINFFISNSLSLTNTLNISAGLMWFNKWKPIVQGVANIIFSIIFAKAWGTIGIFLGTLVSYLIMPIWIEPLVLYKNYFNKSSNGYWGKYLMFSLFTLINGMLTYGVSSLLLGTGVLCFIIKCLICVVLPNVIYMACYFKTKEFRNAMVSVKGILKNIFKE